MLENRTRERLTGAVILVAVIVLLVPELLSGPRGTAPQALAVVDEAPVRSYTLSLGDTRQSTAAATADGVHPDWPPPNSPVPVAPPPPAAADAATKPVTGSAGSATSSAPARPASDKAKSPPAAGAAYATAAHEWAVQVGSFSSRENADRLAHSLKLKGYGAFVSESSSRGRNWYRVRVGPERDRAAADAVAARLRAAGHRGAVAQPR